MTCSDRVHRRSPNATALGEHSLSGYANIEKSPSHHSVDHQANGNEGNGLARKATGAGERVEDGWPAVR